MTNQIGYTGLRQDLILSLFVHVSCFYRKGLALKLVRTPVNVLLPVIFKNIFLSLYAPITSDECYA